MIESIGNTTPSWITGLMDTLGAPGAGAAIAAENLFPPLPSEVILPLAGFAAGRGSMHPASALAWTTLGSVTGALALYGVGALLGRERTVAIAPKLPLVRVADIEKTERWFRRHGTKAVFFGRMIPLFRSFISIPAGIERMPIPVFLGPPSAASSGTRSSSSPSARRGVGGGDGVCGCVSEGGPCGGCAGGGALRGRPCQPARAGDAAPRMKARTISSPAATPRSSSAVT